MKKSKFSEHQIISVLKEVGKGKRWVKSAVSMRSASLCTTVGSRNMEAWKPPSFGK